VQVFNYRKPEYEEYPMQHTVYRLVFILPLILILLISGSILGCSKNTGSQATVSLSQESEDPGDPDWWKKQPGFKEEETAINGVINKFVTALNAKDIETAVSYFDPEERDKYRKVFALSPDLMPDMAKDLEKATLTYLSYDTDNTLNRIAEYSFKVNGNTFRIVFIKSEENWMLKTY